MIEILVDGKESEHVWLATIYKTWRRIHPFHWWGNEVKLSKAYYGHFDPW
jgi:hypothetical protein